ncbi:hypothetical protein DICSQDRAFT_168436 [Dichomitus squalens LYAD-421 SS1]|uniref:uncharacterized protein n=1 Tax=Dichomitus squalens (strain LYAD-421) TaxID=732165 RepID=UPI000441101A|nr:uncharacterized protein DICSQDRAFT_168436 [Dichomitus squalens LYAD-421 SS1]EJF63555.1 hypothetical protein DICSQDRAFT_168436 [Dichomitus squalens LYAD-421 SS1]
MNPGTSMFWASPPQDHTNPTEAFPERGPDGKILVIPRLEQDYPQAAKYWTKRKFEDFRRAEDVTVPGATKGSKGPARLKFSNENVMMQFVIDVHGNVIDGDRASAIRAEMRAWIRGRQDLPETWKGGASVEMKAALYKHMYECFPELQLGDFDWKVEQIAIDVYAQIAVGLRRKKKSLKKKASKTSKKRANHIPRDSAMEMDLDEAPYRMRAQSEDHHGPAPDIITEVNISGGSALQAIAGAQEPSPLAVPDSPLFASQDASPSLEASTANPVASGGMPAPVSHNSQQGSSIVSATTLADVCATLNAARTDDHSGLEIVASDGRSNTSESAPRSRAHSTHADNVPQSAQIPLIIPDPLADLWATSETGPNGNAASPPPSPPPTAGPSTAVGTTSTKASKNDARVRVWPPTPSKMKPKDLCARIWSARNPEGTEAEFDAFYKEKIPTQNMRHRYIRLDGELEAAPSKKGAPKTGNI